MMRTRAFGAMLATVGLLTATAPTLALAAPHPSQITVARGDAVASRTTEVTLPQAEGEAPPVELVDWSDGCFAATDQVAGVWLTYRNNTSGARNIVVAATMFDARPSAEEIATVPIQAGGTRTIVYEADNGLAYRLWEMSNPGREWDAMSSLPDCAKGDPFTDSDYFADGFGREIDWMYQSGTSTGWLERDGTRTYRGLATMNRDAMAAFLYRLAGSPTYVPSGQTFADVTPATAFYKEIEWLASTQITTGWDERDGTKTFRPLTPVNRDAMAAFLYRFSLLQGFPTFTPEPDHYWFDDVLPGTAHFDAIAWMAETGLSTGYEVGDRVEYRPVTPVKRDAIAAFLFRYTDYSALGPDA